MRNGILGAIGEVVGGALTGDVLDEERRETRDALLGKLEVRKKNKKKIAYLRECGAQG